MFSFPLLTNAEILACLDELELGFTEAMLLQPEKHRDEVRNVFEQLAELCCGLSREDVARHARIDVDRLPYSQLHEESVVELAVFRGVADLLRRSGVADFGLRDWHAPSTKRLKKHLSGVINFAKFREDRLAEYVQLCQQRDAIIESAATAQRDALEAQDEVSNVERETYDARQEVASAEDATAVFATDAAAFGRIVASASEKRDDLVDAARVLAEDITNSLEEVRLRDEECARLRDTAPVQTPEELESRIEAMHQELEAIDSAHADHSQELERAMKRQFRPRDRATWEAGVLALWTLPHREEKALALRLAAQHKRFLTLDALPLCERLVREGQWWDLVDEVADKLVGRIVIADPEPALDALDPADGDMETAVLAAYLHAVAMDVPGGPRFPCRAKLGAGALGLKFQWKWFQDVVSAEDARRGWQERAERGLRRRGLHDHLRAPLSPSVRNPREAGRSKTMLV